ncbi:MAG: DinB family protein [Bacteroidia bacterium]|nr:DinB family protein [Bacteroidia bacterium]
MNTDKWTRGLDEVTALFQEKFGHLSAGQLNFKPDPQTWSIAQNLDHLMVINQTYFPVMEALHKGTYEVPFMGKIGFMVKFMGNMILKGVNPDRQRKMRTFPIWEPSQSDIPGDILERFAAHQQQMKNLIEQASGLLDKGVVIASPASSKIVYKLETAFDIILTHEKRHFVQACEVILG